MAHGVKEGRKAVNVSEWAAYPPERQQMLLAASMRRCHHRQDAGALLLRPETRDASLAEGVETICTAARQPGRHAAGVSR